MFLREQPRLVPIIRSYNDFCVFFDFTSRDSAFSIEIIEDRAIIHDSDRPHRVAVRQELGQYFGAFSHLSKSFDSAILDSNR